MIVDDYTVKLFYFVLCFHSEMIKIRSSMIGVFILNKIKIKQRCKKIIMYNIPKHTNESITNFQ